MTTNHLEAGQNPLTPPLLTGVAEIDAEHITLLGLFTQLMVNERAHPGTESFSELFAELGYHLTRHFRHEETLMQALPMSEVAYASHVEAHNRIVEDYTTMNLELMNGSEVSRHDVAMKLLDWIVEHIMRYDTEIGEHVRLTGIPEQKPHCLP